MDWFVWWLTANSRERVMESTRVRGKLCCFGIMGRCKDENATIACSSRIVNRGMAKHNTASYYTVQQVVAREKSDQTNGTRSRGSDVVNCVGLMGNCNEKLQLEKRAYNVAASG